MWASRSGLQLVSSRAAAAVRTDARRVAHVEKSVCTILRGARRASAAGRRRGGGGRGSSIGDEFAAILGATVTLSSSSAHSGTSARAGARLLASWPEHPRRLATARMMSTAGGGSGDSWIGGGVASLEQWLRHHGMARCYPQNTVLHTLSSKRAGRKTPEPLNPNVSTQDPTPLTLNPNTLNLEPLTLNPKP